MSKVISLLVLPVVLANNNKMTYLFVSLEFIFLCMIQHFCKDLNFLVNPPNNTETKVSP